MRKAGRTKGDREVEDYMKTNAAAVLTVAESVEKLRGGIRERVRKGVVGSLTGLMKGRNVSIDVKRALRISILLPTLTYGSENWTWNGAQQSRVRAVETSYLRGTCGVSRWDGLSNECVYERERERERERETYRQRQPR